MKAFLIIFLIVSGVIFWLIVLFIFGFWLYEEYKEYRQKKRWFKNGGLP